MKQNLVIAVCAAGFLTTSCASPQGPDQSAGTMIGGIGGALAGAAIGGHGSGAVIGAGLGALAGGFAGNQIGASMDRSNAQAAYEQDRYREDHYYYDRHDRDYGPGPYRYDY